MSTMTDPKHSAEPPVPLVRGTADAMAGDFERADAIERTLLSTFDAAGYRRVRVPVLERRTLHERKSGARIVGDLFAAEGVAHGGEPTCLRPEMTAGIVRAVVAAVAPAALATAPMRASYAGPVFRFLPTGPGVLREFRQVGVERIGGSDDRTTADAEVINLAARALADIGLGGGTVRIGHAGLVRELLRGSGLPPGLQVAWAEMLGEASHEGRLSDAIDEQIARVSAWLGGEAEPLPPPGASGDGTAIDRLYLTLHPDATGRRSAAEITSRLRRKWAMRDGLATGLAAFRDRARRVADLRGPAGPVLETARQIAPAVAGEMAALMGRLAEAGLDPSRIELDLGFARGIGFYSEMVFAVAVETPEGSVEVCGGGRYDGLARALGSPDDPGGVGFAFGLERLDGALRAAGGRSVR